MLKKKSLRIAALSALSLSVIATASCTSEELIARAGQAAVNVTAALLTPIPVAQQVAIGEEVKREIEKEFGYYNNTAVANYVSSVGATVASNAKRKDEINYRFYVLDSEIVNAFAIPGGSIFVTTGLLKNMKNEAELASVLGHEIAHIDEEHTEESIKRTMVAQGIAEATIDQGSSAIIQIAAQLGYDLVMKGFSRNQERESDQAGTLLISKVNYPPESMIGFFETLIAITGGQEPSGIVQFFQTHPGARERISLIENFIIEENLQVSNPVLNEQRYNQNVAVIKNSP